MSILGCTEKSFVSKEVISDVVGSSDNTLVPLPSSSGRK